VKNDSRVLNYTPVILEYFEDNSSIINIEPAEEVATGEILEKFLSDLRIKPDNYEDVYKDIYKDVYEDEAEEELEDYVEIEAFQDGLIDSPPDAEPLNADETYYDAMLKHRVGYLNSFIQDTGRNSLLNEFVIQGRGDKILVTPYHSHAHYPIKANSRLVIGKPGIIARTTRALFAPEISEFQRLLSTNKLRESHIQSFLEKHPNILKSLGVNYARIYPQVILQRDDGTSLRPDFILQPVDNGWCDILDIKLPNEIVVVGGRDRKRFSSAVEELVAQLREYAAYFEDPRLAKRIQNVYGIKCYRPRMVGVIGRTPRIADDRQMRRLETIYDDLSVITFDRLLEIARTRLLI
jgi:hypothetical protein